jgi:hypothetical protein
VERSDARTSAGFMPREGQTITLRGSDVTDELKREISAAEPIRNDPLRAGSLRHWDAGWPAQHKQTDPPEAEWVGSNVARVGISWGEFALSSVISVGATLHRQATSPVQHLAARPGLFDSPHAKA